MREKFFNALEGMATVGVSIFFVPWAKELFPSWPDQLFEIFVPLLVFLIIAALSLFLWQRPVIEATWKEAEGPALQDVRCKLDANLRSQMYEVSFGGRPKGYLSIFVFWWLRKHGFRFLVHLPGALATTSVDFSSPDGHGGFLGSSDYMNGFSMRVESRPHTGTWLMAKVVFQGISSMNQQQFSVDYDRTANGRFPRVISKFVRLTSPSEHITFY